MEKIEFFDWHMAARKCPYIKFDHLNVFDKASWTAVWTIWKENGRPEVNVYCKGYNDNQRLNELRNFYLKLMGHNPQEPIIKKKPLRILNEA